MTLNKVKKTGTLSLAEMTASRLREEIRNGKYAVGEQLTDEHSLSDQLGVSRGTLRQALKLLGDERLIIRHQGRGTFISNPTCGPIRDRKTSLLGIMVYEKEYYFGKIIHSASARATSRGYMLITGSNITSGEEQRHTDAFLQNAINGVIISPRPEESSDNYDRIIKAGIPVVMVDTKFPHRQEDYVSVDNHQGSSLAAQHLIDLGHKRIAYLGHDNRLDIPCRSNRYRGFMDTCEQAKIDVPAKWQIEANADTYETILAAILTEARPPTAFVTFSDLWAVRVIKEIQKHGLIVPDDISVVGFDNSELSQNYDIPFTTIHPEFEAIGEALVDLLITKIESNKPMPKRSILITPRLVVRNSTAAPRNRGHA